MNVPKLRFKEFNDEYNVLKLSDVAELTSSKRIYLSDYTDNGIPFYRGKEISELKLNKPVSDLLYISDEKYKEIEAKYGVPKENDILVTGVGTLGNIYRIPNNNKFYFKDGNLIWLKNIKQNSEYLEYNLEFNKKKLLDSAIGSTQKALTIAGLNKLSFYYPSTSEQTKVARTMQLIDIKINLQSKKVEDLKLFKLYIRNKIFSGIKTKDKIINTLNYEQPNRYIVKSDDYLNDENLIPVLTANKAFILGYCNEDDYYNKGDVIIFDDFTMDSKYVNFNFKIKSSAIKLLTQKNNNNLKYIFECLQALNLESTEHKRHYISIVQEIEIPVPDIIVQNKIANLMFTYDKKIKLESDNYNKLIELKKGLMQNMFV